MERHAIEIEKICEELQLLNVNSRLEVMWSSRLSVLQYLLLTSSCSDLFRKNGSGIPIKLKQ